MAVPGDSATSAPADAEFVSDFGATAAAVTNANARAPAAAPVSDVVNGSHAASPIGQGYWLVASDGGIFSFGNAGYYGSTGAIHLNKPIVGMAATPDGHGYWLVASDGGIFTFGDGGYFGSTGAMRLNQPIVGMAATPDGQGYWLVASDGGIFTFGDAGYYGSTGAIHLNQPIVGMAATPDGHGYWLVASDGGIFTFGDAGYLGSAPAAGNHVGDIVAMSSSANGQGYWLTGSDGGINIFGDATSAGSMAGAPLNRPIVGFAAVPEGLPATEVPAPLSVTTTTLPNALVGTPYSAVVNAGGGTPPYSWTISAGSLPPGLSLSASGAISGTASAQGTYSFTVQAADGATPTSLTTTAGLTLTVSVPPLVVTTAGLPNAIMGASYGASLAASGGTAPYTWSISGGTVPPGLTLSSAGVINGSPSTQGSYAFTVQVVDSTSPTLTAHAVLSIVVFPTVAGTQMARSSNWAGYVELDGPFTSVTGTFSVPSLSSGMTGTDRMAEWVGIDGGNGDGSLIQAGLNETPISNNPGQFTIQPWWEILPATETYIPSVQIQPGDDVTVTIRQFAGTNWAITLSDDTNGESFTTDQTFTGSATTAEWIVEALTVNGQIVPLAPYSPVVDFSSLGFAGTSASLEEMLMIQNGSQVATPSATSPSGFSVAYGASAPPPP